MRYLWHAFWAKPDIPLLRLPWNAMAMIAAFAGGFFDPAIWGVAFAGEMVYLLTIASNEGFQKWIDERKSVLLRGDSEEARKKLRNQVGGAARRRYEKLEEKRERLQAMYEQHRDEDLLFDSNRHALQKLTWLFLNLLVAQRNLIIAPSSDERELQKQIAACERELASATTESLRSSKQATLRLLRERLDNVEQRSTSLAEIEADLARIETQFDVALEEASLRGRPAAISANIELTSHLLGNLDSGGMYESPSVGAETHQPLRE
jgi:hypothetical protein